MMHGFRPEPVSAMMYFVQIYQVVVLLTILLILILVAVYFWKKIQIMDDERERVGRKR